MHERELNLKLLEGIGIPAGRVTAGLEIPDRLHREMVDRLATKGVDTSKDAFVVIHPGSGDSSLNWPAEHFGRLGKELLGRGIPVVLTGQRSGPGRGGSGPSLHGWWRYGSLWRARPGTAGGPAFRCIPGRRQLHRAPSSGRRVRYEGDRMYSPYVSAAPHRWGPYGQPENVFVPDGDLCPRCTRDRCERHNCLSAIQPETVLARALELLAS